MILSLLFAAAAAAPSAPGELKTFKDWTVGCDNGLACHATSLMPENGEWDQAMTMSVERGPEADAQPALTLLAEDGKEYRLKTAKGQILRLVPRSVSPDYRVDPRDLATALAALRSDSALTLEDIRGTKLGTISLAGITAALLYMDDRQKRLDTVTALVRPGSKPATAVPPPPPLPVIKSAAKGAAKSFAVPPGTVATLRKRFEWEPEDPDWPGYDASEEALDPGRVLLLLGCGAGAYNYSSIAFVATKRGDSIDVQPAAYDLPPSSGDGQPMLVNAEWEGETLTSFAKGRGLGDCGTFADYVWDGQRFRLSERREMDECRGSIDYITTWRTTVVK